MAAVSYSALALSAAALVAVLALAWKARVDKTTAEIRTQEATALARDALRAARQSDRRIGAIAASLAEQLAERDDHDTGRYENLKARIDDLSEPA